MLGFDLVAEREVGAGVAGLGVGEARMAARARAWALAGVQAPGHARTAAKPLVIDLDATLVTSHSDKEQAAPTYKRGYGFHPLCAFVDHGGEGTGEPLAIMLRAGNAGSNTPLTPIPGRENVAGEAWRGV